MFSCVCVLSFECIIILTERNKKNKLYVSHQKAHTFTMSILHLQEAILRLIDSITHLNIVQSNFSHVSIT